MARLNSQLESEGAEFLVLGHLLVEGISAYKAYVRSKDFDLIAVNPEGGTSLTIQVKSRWATDYDGGFLIKNFACDFVAFAALNRGYRYSKKRNGEDDGKRQPQIFIFPSSVVKDAQYEKSSWGKSFLKAIPRVETYENAWYLVKQQLQQNSR